MENFTCAKPVRGSGATREPTGQIWIYDYAVPVCKKGRPNCGGPSEEGKRPAGDDGRSHSKASKPLRCCDTRHCGRHGTPSSCNTNRSDTTASLMSPPLAAFAKLIRHMPPRFPLPVFAWRMLHKLAHVACQCWLAMGSLTSIVYTSQNVLRTEK